MQKEEKSKIKKILKVVLPDLFGLDTVELSDDEDGGDGMFLFYHFEKYLLIDLCSR